jgi:hypothetical protein
LLVAVLATAGLAGSVSADIIFLNGQRALEVRGSADLGNAGAQRYYQNSIGNLPGPVGSASVSGSATANPPISSTAAGSHVVGPAFAGISLNAQANRSGTGAASAYGLVAPNSGFGTPPGYGYLTNFNITSAGAFSLDFDWSPTGTTPAGNGNEAYSDFMGYLWDQTRNRVWAVGGFLDNTGNASSTAIGEPDPSTLPAGATVVPFTLDPRVLNLLPGQYTLYLQGQAYVQGTSGTQFASTNAAVRLQAIIPEPLSITVFGGLLVGGWVARRRLSAKA